MAQWQQPQYNNQRGANNFAGGLNSGTPVFDLDDNESSEEYGFDTDQFPALSVRKGRTDYGATGSAQTNLLANFKDTHMVRAVGTALQYDSAGTWTAITGTFADVDWDATNFNNKLIMTNGTDNVKVWNGSALSDLNATDAPKGKYITNDTVRVWIAKDDILYYSAFLAETDWTTAENSGSVKYYTERGGFITGIKNFANHIVVFKKDSMAEIFGTNYFNFRLIENSNDIGCVSHKTIIEVGDTLFWLGLTDAYAYKGGSPVKIGQKIRKQLNSINQAQIAKCWGGTDGIRYYLGLVTGANTQPDTLCIYDPRYGTWRVHSISGTFRYATYFGGAFYVGDSAGLTHKMNNGTTDAGTAISWAVTSKAFNEGMPEAEKEYFEMHLQVYLPTGSTMTVAVSTDDDSATFTTVQTLTAASDTQSVNIIVPLDTVPLANWLRYKLSGTGPATIYNVERYFRAQPVQI